MQQKGIMKKNWITVFILMILPLFAYGCAGTQASYNALHDVEEGVVLTSYDNLEIKTEAQEKVVIHEYEMERMVSQIKAKLKERNPTCFKDISKNTDAPSTLVLKIKFTKYEKGNAFARAMLAGLGQMHIDAEITIEDKKTMQVLAKHEVKKTFAWGGMYGGITRLEDIEPAFAEAVASIILQEDPKS